MDEPTIGWRREYDAIVVGARAAGAATAMLLGRRGMRVLAVDRAVYGSDTLSTHALMRGGVLQLHRWGLLDTLRELGAPAIRRTVFHYGDEVLDIAIRERDGVDALYAPRRTVLDAVLADAAWEADVELGFGVRVTGLVRAGDGRVVGIEAGNAVAHAPIVVGADGIDSIVARHVGAPTAVEDRRGGGVIYGFFDKLPTDTYDWHFRPGVSAGVIPTNDRVANVFVGMPTERFTRSVRAHGVEATFREVLAEAAPEVAAAIAPRAPVGRYRSFPGRPGFLRQAYGPGWALVGDAGNFKDPLTSHGITDALRDAELLANAVADDALAHYEATRDRLSRPLLGIATAIGSYEWDLPRLMNLHLQMKASNDAECEHLLTLDPAAAAA